MATSRVRVARVYDAPGPDEGVRVLVDRLWPRGLRKDDAPVDAWPKDVAPSDGLRRWYAHDPARYDEFARRYRAELADGDHADALAELRSMLGRGPVILLTATKDVSLSQATVLADHLTEQKG
jgi:uncharacterized protein YeaO (DUF488 family)